MSDLLALDLIFHYWNESTRYKTVKGPTKIKKPVETYLCSDKEKIKAVFQRILVPAVYIRYRKSHFNVSYVMVDPASRVFVGPKRISK